MAHILALSGLRSRSEVLHWLKHGSHRVVGRRGARLQGLNIIYIADSAFHSPGPVHLIDPLDLQLDL